MPTVGSNEEDATEDGVASKNKEDAKEDEGDDDPTHLGLLLAEVELPMR